MKTKATVLVFGAVLLIVGISSVTAADWDSTFTYPVSALTATNDFERVYWGSATLVSRTNNTTSVDFEFTGVSSGGSGVKDDYPLLAVYGQNGGTHNADFSNLTGAAVLVENLDDETCKMHLQVNTGFSSGCWTDDTFWGGPWTPIQPGETVLLTIDFRNAEAWNIDDNCDPHTCSDETGCLSCDNTCTNGSKYAINSADMLEFTSIGFQILKESGDGYAKVRLTPCSAPAEVYVDDSWAGTPDGDQVWFAGRPATMGYDAFASIEEGIGAVGGSTVNVASGTYPEGLVTVDKSLSIIGDAGSRPVVIPTEDTDHSTHRGWFQIEGSGTVVDIKNMVFNGSGKLIENCIRYQSGPTGTVENCSFSNIYWDKYTGIGVVVLDYTAMGGGSPLDISPEFYIKDCTFSDIQRIGMMVFGVDKGYIQNCTYTGKGDGDHLDYGVEVGGGGSAVIENATEIKDCTGLALTDSSTSAGILVTEYYGDPTVAVIDENNLHDNTSGIAVGYGTTDASTVTITDNNIYDNEYGVITSASPGITMTITGNVIHGNSTKGVYNESSNLVAYSNKFAGNGTNAEDNASSANQWNSSSCPGNYWDDYLSNGGYPGQYNITGTAGSIDDCPLSIGVTLDPATHLMACGETITYHVNVDGNALDLMGADYKINYDSTKLSFVSAVVGSLLNTGTGEYIFTYQPSTGQVLINSAHLGTGVNGPGEIAEVAFQSTGSTSPGSTSLTFSDTELRDSGNQTLPSTWTGASVVIDCVAPTISVTLDAPTSPWTCYNTAPTVDITAGDDYDVDCVKYKIDAGSWTDIVCGLSGTSYTNNDWSLPDFGSLSEGSHTYYFKSTDDAGNESSEDSVTFTKDTVPPSAVTDFTATVGHNQIALDWTNPGSDVDRIYLYRNDWTDYPQYTTDPGYPGVGSYDAQTDVGAVETYTDTFTNTTRGIYAYRAVVYDCAGNYASAGSGDHDRATSYFLGDIASSGGSYSPNYDGLVSGFDYNPFSGCYWSSPPAGNCLEADFAPTIEPARGRFGIPQPDAYVGFEDLMIFSMNYGNVPPPSPPGAPVLGVELASAGLAEDALSYRVSLREVSEAGEMVELALVVEGNDVFKGLSAEVEYDPSGLEFVSVMPSEALVSGSRVLFMGDEVGGVIRVDLAALGGGVGIGGNGPVAMLSFLRRGESGSSVKIASVDARDVDNNVLLLTVEDEVEVKPGLPEVFALRGNSPNPFTGSTEISYDIPRESSVVLRIYNIQGQVVRTLVDGAVAAGRHSETWDGFDSEGRRVSAGVYFCEMRSGSFVSTHKLMISR